MIVIAKGKERSTFNVQGSMKNGVIALVTYEIASIFAAGCDVTSRAGLASTFALRASDFALQATTGRMADRRENR